MHTCAYVCANVCVRGCAYMVCTCLCRCGGHKKQSVTNTALSEIEYFRGKRKNTAHPWCVFLILLCTNNLAHYNYNSKCQAPIGSTKREYPWGRGSRGGPVGGLEVKDGEHCGLEIRGRVGSTTIAWMGRPYFGAPEAKKPDGKSNPLDPRLPLWDIGHSSKCGWIILL